MTARLHWRRHCPGDHLAHAADLTIEEDGALLRLLDWYWMNGPIPADAKLATKLIRAPKVKAAMVGALLDRFFALIDVGYVSPVLDEERSHAVDVVRKRKDAGRAGGQAKAKANATAIAEPSDWHSLSDQITSDHIRSDQITSEGEISSNEEISTETATGNTRARGTRLAAGGAS